MDKKILLIADDDDMNRLIIRKFLKEDYEVIEAVDGRDTMKVLHERHVDALLLDIIMPHMDGLEVLAAMKQEKELDHVGILVATSTKEKTEREALSLGADDIVAKPYDPVVIKKRMANILLMKSVRAQKELLKSDDVQSYLAQQKDKLAEQVGASMNKIEKFTDIIKANKSNYKLVDEISDAIMVEARSAMDAILEAE